MKNNSDSVTMAVQQAEKEKQKFQRAFNDAYNKPNQPKPHEFFAKRMKISVEEAESLFFQELLKADTFIKKVYASSQVDLICLMEYVMQKESLSEEAVWNIVDNIKERKYG